MSVLLTQGTKEVVPVDLTDRTGTITDLSAASCTFDVVNDANVSYYTAQAATGVGMEIRCLLDTSAAHALGLWAVGHYRLFVKFTVGSESPRLGPTDIYIYNTN